jgi:glucokinase
LEVKKYIIGVEIGGTKLQVVLGSGDGEILERRRGAVDPARGAEGILAWSEEAVAAIQAIVPKDGAVDRIGVGFGGPVENRTGRVLTSHQVAGWDGVELKFWLEERFGVPTIVENDANAAGWAEYRLGAGRGTKNFVYCNIGSGIGGALVVDGQLYNGQGFGACEIGHTYVSDWTAATPGAVDKLEHLCSGWSITRRIQSWTGLEPGTPLFEACGGDPTQLTCPMLATAARAGDPVAQGEIGAIAAGVGCALTNVITLLHPEKIALGGGVSLMGEVLLDPIRAYIDRHVYGPYQGTCPLVPCELEEDVVTAGALMLVSDGT